MYKNLYFKALGLGRQHQEQRCRSWRHTWSVAGLCTAVSLHKPQGPPAILFLPSTAIQGW